MNHSDLKHHQIIMHAHDSILYYSKSDDFIFNKQFNSILKNILIQNLYMTIMMETISTE